MNNIELIKLMKNLKENPTKKNEDLFFDEFKEASLIAPVIIDDEKEDMDITFISIKDINNTSYYPVFLDYESFINWNNDESITHIVITYHSYYRLFNMIKDTHYIALDPMKTNLIISDVAINRLVSK